MFMFIQLFLTLFAMSLLLLLLCCCCCWLCTFVSLFLFICLFVDFTIGCCCCCFEWFVSFFLSTTVFVRLRCGLAGAFVRGHSRWTTDSNGNRWWHETWLRGSSSARPQSRQRLRIEWKRRRRCRRRSNSKALKKHHELSEKQQHYEN